VGEYPTEGFVVLKGSKGRIENVASIQGKANERFREKLLEEGILAANGAAVVLTRDYLFSSPCMAAVALPGRSANGWVEWKDAKGRTLDEVKRQAEAVQN